MKRLKKLHKLQVKDAMIDTIVNFTVYQGEIKARTVSLKKHSTAFTQSPQFEQQDG